MLAIAATKVPGAQLVEGDMADFDLGRRFDVVACVFDSINHLLDVASWASLLACVHRHLTDGGLFVFDVNTVGELHRLGEEPPWVYDFGGGMAVIDVTFALDPAGLGVTDWDIRIFEQVDGTRYELHHERIGELALPLETGAGPRGRPLRAPRGGGRGRAAGDGHLGEGLLRAAPAGLSDAGAGHAVRGPPEAVTQA